MARHAMGEAEAARQDLLARSVARRRAEVRHADIDRVPLSSLTPRRFFDEYVSQRKPVVLVTDGFAETEWEECRAWSDGYLRDAAR